MILIGTFDHRSPKFFLLRVGNLGSDNSVIPRANIASKQQIKVTDNMQHSVEVRQGILIKTYLLFLPLETDLKYSRAKSDNFAVTAVTEGYGR